MSALPIECTLDMSLKYARIPNLADVSDILHILLCSEAWERKEVSEQVACGRFLFKVYGEGGGWGGVGHRGRQDVFGERRGAKYLGAEISTKPKVTRLCQSYAGSVSSVPSSLRALG